MYSYIHTVSATNNGYAVFLVPPPISIAAGVLPKERSRLRALQKSELFLVMMYGTDDTRASFLFFLFFLYFATIFDSVCGGPDKAPCDNTEK